MGKDDDKEVDLQSRVKQLEEKAESLENEKIRLKNSLDDLKKQAESRSEKAKEAMANITAINDEIAEILRKKAVLDANITSEESLRDESRQRIADDKLRLENIENEINGSDERKKNLDKAIEEQTEKKQSAENVLAGYELIAENKEKK